MPATSEETLDWSSSKTLAEAKKWSGLAQSPEGITGTKDGQKKTASSYLGQDRQGKQTNGEGEPGPMSEKDERGRRIQSN